MAGLYIHIPFCKSRCIYCGFYSTTSEELRQRYVDAVCKEMEMRGEWREIRGERKDENGERIETIYLGGGTPSQLSGNQLQQLFIYINKVYGLEHVREVTMECNPDDVTAEYATMLSRLPVNRVSMGVQTFSDERLRFLRRRHTAEQIPMAVERLRQAGIQNISIDLMYGFPDETLEDWHEDIRQALSLNVEHLSAYALMYEEGTHLYQLLEEGKVSEIDEELSLQMYSDLIDRLKAAGYEHYEISNFARREFRSTHNSSYWNQTPYIGLGAAAHSYNGHERRRWNIDNIQQYIEGIESGEPVFEEEVLDDDTRYNDLVMTALRTCEGLSLPKLSPVHQDYCKQQAHRFIHDGLLAMENNHLRLTRRGLFVSNMIMSELMKV
ncbi:MAG: radical SAM family heme chaperone HemW [Prevotella sp.]|nr:radical SAM family heme chaperone HemW [Prevotella sp.]